MLPVIRALVFRSAAILVLVAPGAAQAAGAAVERLQPPRGAAATAYLEASRFAGLQNEIDYLPPDAPLDAELKEAERPLAFDPFAGPIPLRWRIAGWVGLALFAAGALLLLLRFRHALAELFASGDRSFAPRGADASSGGGPVVDHDLLARLRAETDPRVGLRLVLKRFLALAARENALVLRRSLTTREVLRALPGGWRHRDALERLATRVELTVFGGRPISREAYEECLDLAAPLLFRVKGA